MNVKHRHTAWVAVVGSWDAPEAERKVGLAAEEIMRDATVRTQVHPELASLHEIASVVCEGKLSARGFPIDSEE